MTDKFIIRNQAQFQLFSSLYAAALIGETTRRHPQTKADDIARKADRIAVAAMERFNSHIPDHVPGQKPAAVVDIIKP